VRAEADRQQEEAARQEKPARAQKNATADLIGAFAKSAVRAVGSQVGRQIMRGIFGSMLGGRKNESVSFRKFGLSMSHHGAS
jgi:hypothetical protein